MRLERWGCWAQSCNEPSATAFLPATRFEALPGAHVNGALTLGENIADRGGLSIAFEALQRRLAKDPSRRKKVEGLTPEQRFFVSYAQIWRETARPQDVRRRLTTDEHAPAKFRVIGAVSNATPFFESFNVREGALPVFGPAPRPLPQRR